MMMMMISTPLPGVIVIHPPLAKILIPFLLVVPCLNFMYSILLHQRSTLASAEARWRDEIGTFTGVRWSTLILGKESDGELKPKPLPEQDRVHAYQTENQMER